MIRHKRKEVNMIIFASNETIAYFSTPTNKIESKVA